MTRYTHRPRHRAPFADIAVACSLPSAVCRLRSVISCAILPEQAGAGYCLRHGYGTNLLAQTAVSVLGVDQDAATIAYCPQKYPNCCFMQGDATTLVLDEPVDVVISL